MRSADKRVKHHPALPVAEIGTFLRELDNYANRKTALALRLLILTLTRSGEVRRGEWTEISGNTWHIPAEKMKMGLAHTVPLSDWALELLRELHGLTGNTPYLFPSRTKQDGHISENTLGKIMNGMSYKGIATPHGFRSLASSILNEQGYNPDAIERQLAHEESNRIRAAYNRAEYLAERREMMQWYSGYLRERYRQAKALIATGGAT